MSIKWQICPEVLSSKIDEEVIIMSINTDKYIGLDQVGSLIWEFLSKQPLSTESLIDLLQNEYEVDKATCRADVQEFLLDMESKKLVQRI